VAATDLYDGLATVSNVFVGTTLTALDELQQLHTYLLIASIAVFVAVVVVMLLPFKKRVVMESVRLAGLLSQLPQVRWLLLRACWSVSDPVAVYHFGGRVSAATTHIFTSALATALLPLGSMSHSGRSTHSCKGGKAYQRGGSNCMALTLP
jgi:hypothetical protein